MRPDEILLVDMLQAAREAVGFLGGIDFADFERDRLRQLAVIKSIEIIGEAAGRISDEFQHSHADIPWRDIIGMRHRLVHGYFEINIVRVWSTVREDLPGLVAAIEPLVPPEKG
jgi:uncharacterized protein with HEPN domain